MAQVWLAASQACAVIENFSPAEASTADPTDVTFDVVKSPSGATISSVEVYNGVSGTPITATAGTAPQYTAELPAYSTAGDYLVRVVATLTLSGQESTVEKSFTITAV